MKIYLAIKPENTQRAILMGAIGDRRGFWMEASRGLAVLEPLQLAASSNQGGFWILNKGFVLY